MDSTKFTHTLNIAVLIPAAGASSRMGTPKQLLKWGATTLLGHTIETALQLKAQETVVVLGAHFRKIKEGIAAYECVILEHVNWESGLGSSIAFGMKHLLQTDLKVDGVLILLGDQPLIDAPYLQSMVKAFTPGEQQIVATAYGTQKCGVPALFDTLYFDELSVLSEDQGAKAIIERHTTSVLTLPAPPNSLDIDTPEDYERLYNANHQL